jgi:hypothetical protein
MVAILAIFFLLYPVRSSILLTVDSLTSTPAARPRNPRAMATLRLTEESHAADGVASPSEVPFARASTFFLLRAPE